MTLYVLGIGSNVNAEYQCRQMLASIEQAFDGVRASGLVTTTAVGLEAPDYTNAVVCFESDMPMAELRQWCKTLEEQLGRDRDQALCAADIDLLVAYSRADALSAETIINQVREPWFRPLLVELFNRDIGMNRARSPCACSATGIKKAI